MDDEERAVPGNESIAPPEPDPAGTPPAASPGLGTVVLSRVNRSDRDAFRGYAVLIDDTQVGSINRGQTLRFEVPPGTHQVQLKIDWCTSHPLTALVEEGKTVRFICSPGGDASEGLNAVRANRGNYITLQETSEPIVMARTQTDRGTRMLVGTACGFFLGGVTLIGALIWNSAGLAPDADNTVAGASLAVTLASMVVFSLRHRKAGRHPRT
ncbi:hypothetical protein ACWD3J_47720 [Streptomyces sp. NPDC002755]|uniref:hypothetical protein n=1 Tax=Streptomyces sp. NPDC002884 TaxID=3154544 RepID=UPI00332A3037